MIIRNRLEETEHLHLSPRATFSDESRGRVRPEELSDTDARTCFQRDADRIVHSKAFRRLMHKTQVFLSPEGDHYRTRMTHTLEVSRISRSVARALGLNEDLTEAIALGHDLGHTPFGHAGEDALSEMLGKPFRHNEQSLRVVDYLENDGAGLNLTHEVRMGILGHTGDYIPETLEGQVVRICDRVAYVNHDMDDAVRAGVLTEQDIPKDIRRILGETYRDRINVLVSDAIESSIDANTVALSPTISQAFLDLRSFMFERVYRNPDVKGEEAKAKDMIKRMYTYYMENPDAIPMDFQPQLSFDGAERTVCDYIAGMTDNYAVDKFTRLSIPMGWHVR